MMGRSSSDSEAERHAATFLGTLSLDGRVSLDESGAFGELWTMGS